MGLKVWVHGGWKSRTPDPGSGVVPHITSHGQEQSTNIDLFTRVLPDSQ